MNNIVSITTLVTLCTIVYCMTLIIIKYFEVISKNPDANDSLSTPFLIGLGFIEVFGLVSVGIAAYLIVS